jgi:hypothetical protein
MIRWYEQLYTDDFIVRNMKYHMKRVESGKDQKKRITIITLASNPDNLFDIVDSRELSFCYYRKRDIYILGLAKNKKEAIQLLIQLVNKVWKRDEFNPREYFSKDKFMTRKDLERQQKRGKR